MQAATDRLVVMITRGIDFGTLFRRLHHREWWADAGLKVSIFLTSAAIDLVRRGGQRLTHVHPMEPLAALIEDFQKRGGVIWACTPLRQVARLIEQSDLLDGVIITGASVMHAEIREARQRFLFDP